MSTSHSSRRPTRNQQRILFTLAVFSLILSLFIRWPGSVPRGWQYTTGTISSVVGRQEYGTTKFYPTIQYLALGYSYEITSRHGLATAPQINSGTYRVAFLPDNPNQAKLIGEVPPNYFAFLLPLVALLLVLFASRYHIKRLYTSLIARIERHIARKAEAIVAAEAAQQTVLEPLSPPLPEAPISDDTTTQLDIEPEPVTESIDTSSVESETATISEAERIPESSPVIEAEELETSTLPEVVAPVPAETEAPSDVPVGTIEPAPVSKPKIKKQVKTAKPSAPKSIYIPHVESKSEPESAAPRSAAELKTKLKTAKPKTKKPSAPKATTPKTTVKKSRTESTKTKKPSVKKTAPKKRVAQTKATAKK
ncbi:MAG TPA: hypothetical protein VFN56_05015 [Candidatus Saccharimonadales bacterium]|nr:hypothetical protein [Candidatus Saccharimonadales bacterium]